MSSQSLKNGARLSSTKSRGTQISPRHSDVWVADGVALRPRRSPAWSKTEI